MEWQCVGHDPTTWALGRREGDRMIDIVAQVTRNQDGRWYWWSGDYLGLEPSRTTAMEAAEKTLESEYQAALAHMPHVPSG